MTDTLRSRIIAHTDQPDIYDPPAHTDMYARILRDADRIEVLQAERCVEVKPLEWVQDEEFGKCYLKAETAFGVVRCVPEDMPKFTGRHVEAVMRFITTRPASEVRAEAHAAAIEAAASIYEGAFDSLAGLIRALHTDASREYLAAREERIKREAREEALREAAEAAKKKAREYEQTYDNTTEIGTAVHAAITALIEKGGGDAFLARP